VDATSATSAGLAALAMHQRLHVVYALEHRHNIDEFGLLRQLGVEP